MDGWVGGQSLTRLLAVGRRWWKLLSRARDDKQGGGGERVQDQGALFVSFFFFFFFFSSLSPFYFVALRGEHDCLTRGNGNGGSANRSTMHSFQQRK